MCIKWVNYAEPPYGKLVIPREWSKSQASTGWSVKFINRLGLVAIFAHFVFERSRKCPCVAKGNMRLLYWSAATGFSELSSLYNSKGPIIACSDYVKLVSEQISPYIDCDFTSIGTDGFGRSGSREELRDFFEINKYYITLAAVHSLSKQNKVDKKLVQKVINKYKINPDKINPLNC